MAKRRKVRKKRDSPGQRSSFSDKLYWLNFKMAWIFVFLCFLLTVFSGKLDVTDMAIVNVGVPAAFTELGLHTGFIIWKHKTENCRKHKDVNLLNELEVIEP